MTFDFKSNEKLRNLKLGPVLVNTAFIFLTTRITCLSHEKLKIRIYEFCFHEFKMSFLVKVNDNYNDILVYFDHNRKKTVTKQISLIFKLFVSLPDERSF